MKRNLNNFKTLDPTTPRISYAVDILLSESLNKSKELIFL